MPEYVRVYDEVRGEFSVLKESLHRYKDVRVLEGKPATLPNGRPVPHKPKTSVAAQAAKASEPQREAKRQKFGQKATTADTEE